MSDFSVDGIINGLAKASDEIKREVGALIPSAAQQMLSTITARYPVGHTSHPGRPHMKEDGYIRTVQGQDARLPVRRVIGPRLAYIWQNGTVERYDSTRRNARRGRMPAAAPGFFERTAVQVRAEMMQRAQAVLDRPRTIDTISSGGRFL